MPKRVKGRLLAVYSRKRGKGHVIQQGGISDADAGFIARIFRREPPRPEEKSLWEELETRGYDLATFRFSIDKKKADDGSPLE